MTASAQSRRGAGVMRSPHRQRGQFLVLGIVLIVVVGLMISALGFMYVSSERSSSIHGEADSAYFVARSGLESAIYQFSQLDTACATLVAAGNTNVAVGAGALNSGSFTITGATLYPTGAIASTLTGAGITTTTPGVITVTSIANFAPHGRIRIENEEIDYSSTSASAAVCGAAPCFISWRRGVNNALSLAANNAVVHAAGVSVFQDDQCLIQSTGCADTTCAAALTTGVAKRVLETTVK